jgi:hypothetical protein
MDEIYHINPETLEELLEDTENLRSATPVCALQVMHQIQE